MFAIKNLSSTDLELLKKNLKEKHVDKGDIIIESGLTGSSMYFVETGTLKYIKRETIDTKEDQILGVIKAGSFCGEESILSENAPYRYTVVAQENSVLQELTQDSMQHIMASSMMTGTKILLGVSKDYREALTMSTQTARIISFVSPKDGAGRTTMATSVAVQLGKKGKKVIIIDADLQLGDASLKLGSLPSPNISRLVQMEERLTFDRIERFFIQKKPVKLLAGPNLPQEADLISRTQMTQIIQECAKNCDFVIIDSGSHIDEIAMMTWDMADMLFLVTTPDLSCAMRLKRLMTAVSRLNYPKEKFHGILNKFKPANTDYLEIYKKTLNCNWFEVAHDEEAIDNAIGYEKFLSDVAANSQIVKDLNHIAMHITGEESQAINKGGIFSWLSSIFAK